MVPLDHEIRKLVSKRSCEKQIASENARHHWRPGRHVYE